VAVAAVMTPPPAMRRKERRFMVGSGGWRCDALWKPVPPSTIGEPYTPAMQK
jgi:hypothetical protein